MTTREFLEKYFKKLDYFSSFISENKNCAFTISIEKDNNLRRIHLHTIPSSKKILLYVNSILAENLKAKFENNFSYCNAIIEDEKIFQKFINFISQKMNKENSEFVFEANNPDVLIDKLDEILNYKLNYITNFKEFYESLKN
jgi:hypothetical protein